MDERFGLSKQCKVPSIQHQHWRRERHSHCLVMTTTLLSIRIVWIEQLSVISNLLVGSSKHQIQNTLDFFEKMRDAVREADETMASCDFLFTCIPVSEAV